MTPPTGWTPQPEWDDRAKWYRTGWFGNNAHTMNVHTIEFSEHVNGSGPKAFNGSQSWPALHIRMSFLDGQEELREQIALRIAAVIDEMLPDR